MKYAKIKLIVFSLFRITLFLNNFLNNYILVVRYYQYSKLLIIFIFLFVITSPSASLVGGLKIIHDTMFVLWSLELLIKMKQILTYVLYLENNSCNRQNWPWQELYCYTIWV